MSPLRWFLLSAVAGIGLVVALGAVRGELAERCTESWDGATVIDVSFRRLMPDEVGRISPYRDARIEGRYFPEVAGNVNKTVGGSSAPRLPFAGRSIGMYFHIVAEDEDTMNALVPLCIRASFKGSEWLRRAHPHDVYTRADGRPVGGAGAGRGPDWPADATVRLSLLVLMDGERYILDAGEVPIGRVV